MFNCVLFNQDLFNWLCSVLSLELFNCCLINMHIINSFFVELFCSKPLNILPQFLLAGQFRPNFVRNKKSLIRTILVNFWIWKLSHSIKNLIVSLMTMAAKRMLPSVAYDTTDFESSRIKELKSERLRIQQKTFTKWINSFLQRIGIQVETRILILIIIEP